MPVEMSVSDLISNAMAKITDVRRPEGHRRYKPASGKTREPPWPLGRPGGYSRRAGNPDEAKLSTRDIIQIELMFH